ncbi:glutamyl-tRNA amidotransferas-like protein [Paraphoma chrysanthemicola]|nr:glutamyl-tRNA amidotransferas-like protein [Paraphoma chrysanthemicola]
MSFLSHAKQYTLNQIKYAHLNAFVSRIDTTSLSHPPKSARQQKDGELDSFRYSPIAIKDNICTKDLKTTAASGILKDFVSPYDATVVELLRDAGAVVVGKTNMDEFGMGSHTINSHAGPARLQRYEGEERSAGGSSGGSALAVASAQCWAALGTDTGGSVRLPAAYTGVYGFKPSYGLLSRWGVLAYANSLDTVGIFAKNAQIIGNVFDKLNVYDPKDPTSLPPSTRARLESNREPTTSLRIGIPLDYNIATLQPAVRNAWVRALKGLAGKGHTLHPVRLPSTHNALSAYYILAPAEASSNLAKYDGVRFGSRAEGLDGTPESVLFAKTRGDGFGAEVQRRILLGAFSLSAQAIDNYFIQAQKVRRTVQEDFNKVFAKVNPLVDDAAHITTTEDQVDVVICPTAPTLAPSLSEVRAQDSIQSYMNDVFTVPASLAGLPAISVPVPITKEERGAIHGDHNIEDSAGIQIIGQYGDDKLVLHAAQQLSGVCKTMQCYAGPDLTAWGESSFGKSTVNERKKYGDLAAILGITIAEAIPIFEESKEKLGKLFHDVLGPKHLEEAAKNMPWTREEYIAKFATEDDPLAAEEVFHDQMTAQRKATEAEGLAKATTLPGDARSVRNNRLRLLENPRVRHREGRVRFVGVGEA